MSLIRTSLLNGIAVAVKLACALVLNKILAVYVGPAGYAVIGQFQNVVSVVVNLAGGVVATGVTKVTAQYFDDPPKQHAVWKTAIRLALFASVATAISLILWGDWLTSRVLLRAELSSVFVWLGFSLPAIATNTIFMAIINGKKEVVLYVVSNILGSLLSLLTVGLFTYSYGLSGALIAFCLSPAIMLLASGTLCASRRWFRSRFLWGPINAQAMRELSGFGLMGLTSALTLPITYSFVRQHLAATLGLPAAGHWQAVWKISELYLMLITSTLSVYYLPRLAEIRTAQELKAEIFKVYRLVLPVVATGALSIYFLRDFIISALFTADFAPMSELLPWQLTGDVIKIGAWVLAFILHGRAMVRVFIVTEVLFAASFYILTLSCVNEWGLSGVAIAYAANYTLYWICMAYFIRREIVQMKAIL